MTIGEALRTVMTDYGSARAESFTAHRMGAVLRQELPRGIAAALGDGSAGLLIRGSAGQGTWAAVPWVSVFDRAITETAQSGYYVVYLFHADGGLVHLSLNQGTTAVRAEFRSRAPAVLRDRARLIRERLSDFVPKLPLASIELGSEAQLPTDYEAGHALGTSYRLDSLPTDGRLRDDLVAVVEAYRVLTFRGGLDPTPELEPATQGSVVQQLTEARRYGLHQRIERNSRASKLAKLHHGLRCQACDLDFVERYGSLGEGFIEAHHLRPLSSLNEGESVSYDLAEDFAVLCANCHRMMHRPCAPDTVAGLRELLRRCTPKPRP